MEIKCRKCNKELNETNWYGSLKKINSKLCRTCHLKDCHERDLKRYKNFSSYREYKYIKAKKRREKYRLLCLKYYSNNTLSCACCGENKLEFLAIDHIKGNGFKHRKEIKNPSIFYWLIKNNYPKGFRVLCHNCNLSLGYYGYCPHKGGTK